MHWDLVGEGMDDNAALAQNALVDLAVICIAGEAGKVPDQQALRAFIGLGRKREHLVELGAAIGRFAGDGGVFEEMVKDEAVLSANFMHDLALLFHRSVLAAAARIAQIGPDG